MIASNNASNDLAPFIDWPTFDRSGGTWSELCNSLEGVQEPAGYIAGGPTYGRIREGQGMPEQDAPLHTRCITSAWLPKLHYKAQATTNR